MSVVKVLVVDDSATMRSLISAVLRRDPEITVVGQAGDPLEAREAIKQLNPDVLTLDVEMPNMNGLAFLEKIMRLRPMPVVMVSTLTQVGAEVSLAALELGAIECVGKPTGGLAAEQAFAGLAAKVKAAARARVRSAPDRAPNQAAQPDFRPDGRLVAIGSSTGGVEALLSVLSAFPANCPPTVITQHMPGTFTRSFAERLNRTCAAKVAEASEGAVLEVGQIYLAPGGDNHLQVTGHSQLRCRLVPEPPVNGHRPSVDVLFHSVVKTVGSKAVGVILTGMGRDGAQGLLAMRQAGAQTIGQNEATSVVYGMPKVAHEIGGVARQLPLERIGAEIINQCNLAREPA
jgi:two-component system chemotaxis response regulator CheB